MKVVLKRNWFAPGFGRIRRGLGKSNPVEVPEQFRNCLPRDAEIVDDDYVAPVPEQKEIHTLGEAADILGIVPEVAAAETEAKAQAEAEGARKREQDKKITEVRDERTTKAAEKFQADLAAEEAEEAKEAKPGKRGRGRKTPKEG